MTGYLRVKKWKDWQHYKDREPPWIKLHAKLLRDSAFMELTEAEQWQLARIWLACSLSSRFTVDEEGLRVPVIAHDETTIRRAIASLKKVPLTKFVAEGWLIPIAEDKLVENTPDASTVLAPNKPDASTLLEAEKQRSRETERPTKPSRPSEARPDETQSLPIEKELLTAKLLNLIGDHADEGTPAVVRSYAHKLAPAALARVRESLEHNHPKNRARYAVAALKAETQEAA